MNRPDEDPAAPAGDAATADLGARARLLSERDRHAEAVEAAGGWLAAEPENLEAHVIMAWALIEEGRPKEAKPHVELLLGELPDNGDIHFLAAVYHEARHRARRAMKHVREALALEPDAARHHAFMAQLQAERGDLKKARQHAAKARELEPEAADYAHLDIRLRTADKSGAKNALRAIAELEETLAGDPQNAALHNALGDMFLDELEDPRTAEVHYRRALEIEPDNAVYRGDLFRSIARRDTFFRTLSLPLGGAVWLGRLVSMVAKNPLNLIWLLLGIKFFGAFVAWLAVALVVMGPAALFYRWTILADLQVRTGVALFHSPLANGFCQLHPAARGAAFAAALLGQWLLLAQLLGTGFGASLQFAGIFFLVHLVVVIIAVGVRKTFSALGRWRAGRGH